MEQQGFESKRLVKLAWESAYFQRVRDFPRLSEVLGEPRPVLRPEQEAAQVKALFTSLGAGMKQPAPKEKTADG